MKKATGNLTYKTLFFITLLCYSVIALSQKKIDAAQQNVAVFKRFVLSEHFIPLPNGVQISVIVVRHDGDTAPAPALLIASCYPQSYNDVSSIKTGLRKGYVGVMVYSRGKEKSTGVFEPFEHEAEDTYDIIDWVSKQSWCNGKVGMFGGSYLGFTQWAACKKLHPALKTIVPQVAVAPGIDYPMQNGIFMPYMLRWINYTTNTRLNDSRIFGNWQYWKKIYNEYYKNGLAFNKLDSLDNLSDKIFQRWLQHPDYDDYWANMIPSTPAEYAAIHIPILTITGYFDADQLGALYYYKMHQVYGNKDAVKNHYLLMGPWSHAGAQGYPSKKIGSYKVDSLALLPITELVMDWFDYIFKGKNKPDILKNGVNYFVMGDEWKHVASLAEMNKDSLHFFLTNQSDGLFYKLVQDKKANTGPINFSYDPTDISDSLRVKTDDNEVYSPITNEYLRQKNQLIFQTEPLKNDIIVTGSPMADLFISINKKDIDFSLDYYEVSPEGASFQLSSFIQRASYYNNKSKKELVVPDAINRYLFTNSFFTSKLIKKGSVLRVVIKPLNVPVWQKNYGSGKDVSKETMADASPFVIKIFTGRKTNSKIVFPYNSLN
jgi:uncharacterized protein